MSTGYEITFRVINRKIDSFRKFSYVELTKEIIDNDGILRTSIMVTIKDYLERIMSAGIIFREGGTDFYIGNPLMLLNLYKKNVPFSDSLKEKFKEKTKIENEAQLVEVFGESLIKENPKLLEFVK